MTKTITHNNFQTIPIMNKKPFQLLVLISLFSISAAAQIEADISRPSINVEQFGLAVKAENALNKGQLSLNIPLKAKDIICLSHFLSTVET